MREVTEAHYLHERHGLEAVLRPPIRNPTALAWIPKKEKLVVGTRDGCLHLVDPIMGVKVVAEDIGEPARIAISEDKKTYLVVSRNGVFTVGELGGDKVFSGKHAFLSGIDCFWLNNHIVMFGNEVDGRMLVVANQAKVKLRAKLPENVVAMPDDGGSGLLLGRSTPKGLEVIHLGKDRFERGLESTVHRLIYSGQFVLGITPTGVVVWPRDGGTPQSMRLPDLTVGEISADGRYLGLGTRSGAVALARIDEKEKRIRPDLVKAFDGPVTSVAFSQRGRWLATGGTEHLQIWSWED